jgi:hypothetical protein
MSRGLMLAQHRARTRLAQAEKRTMAALLDRDPKLWLVSRGFKAPRPGSNLLSMVELRDVPTGVTVSGEDIEMYYRSGVLSAVPMRDENVVVLPAGSVTSDAPDVDLTHAYFLTEAGKELVKRSVVST